MKKDEVKSAVISGKVILKATMPDGKELQVDTAELHVFLDDTDNLQTALLKNTAVGLVELKKLIAKHTK